MDYKAQVVSSQSSFNFVTRFLVARSEPVATDAPAKGSQKVRRGSGLLSVLLFIALFFGILSALGLGLSGLSNHSNLSQTFTEYVRRLS